MRGMNGSDGKDGDNGRKGPPGERVSYLDQACCMDTQHVLCTTREIKVHLEYLVYLVYLAFL